MSDWYLDPPEPPEPPECPTCKEGYSAPEHERIEGGLFHCVCDNCGESFSFRIDEDPGPEDYLIGRDLPPIDGE